LADRKHPDATLSASGTADKPEAGSAGSVCQ
jgi:hypothetical protein